MMENLADTLEQMTNDELVKRYTSLPDHSGTDWYDQEDHITMADYVGLLYQELSRRHLIDE
jgi:hypothetical protein